MGTCPVCGNTTEYKKLGRYIVCKCTECLSVSGICNIDALSEIKITE